ncbi:methyltransferase [Candidatus Sumerlaeota bacterium]
MQSIEIIGVGPCAMPDELLAFTGPPCPVEVRDARDSPKALLERLAAGAWLAIEGPYAYVDAIYRYCQHNERALVSPEDFAHIPERPARRAAMVETRRRKLHHLLVVARDDGLPHIEEAPELAGLQDWLLESPGERPFLIPVRRLQRILVDMRRAREGVRVPGLARPLAILPHVYVPWDGTVPAMFAEYGSLMDGKRVLDIGAATGVLALLAAEFGAARVVATDSNPRAVENARVNVERFGLAAKIDVRPPADMFEAVGDEEFDVILFNAPWAEGEPQTLYDTAIYDPERQVLGKFLAGAEQRLAPDGVVLLQLSDVSSRAGGESLEFVRELVEANGLRIAGSRHIVRESRLIRTREKVYVFEIRRNNQQ